MIRFLLNGEMHEVAAASPSTSMLDYLRQNLRLTAAKEGCAEGDCGACTIIRVRGEGAERRYEAVNGCLMQLGQADGDEILTVEGLQTLNGGALAPVQEALASGHGTQCGYCTPGFVAALFALQQSGEEITEAVVHDALAGNLCRCTGYRPIVEAAMTACAKAPTPTTQPTVPAPRQTRHEAVGQVYHAPADLAELTALRARYPEAMLLAGGTDLGLLISKDRQRPAIVLHTDHVAELGEIVEDDAAVTFGAAVSYSRALPVLDRLYPSFAQLIRRIGSRQIRNLGTIGGNIGNASPIGDTPPCLIALDARLTLASVRGEREIAIEDFFLDYRKTALAPDEVIRAVRIPKPAAAQVFRAYKISKRHDQDISAVIGAFRLTLEKDKVVAARIAYGGMAATPKRASAVERALTGAVWTEAAAAAAGAEAAQDFAPIGDHRASAGYRTRVAGNLPVRLWRELSGTDPELAVTELAATAPAVAESA